ncbi:hypothetical protein PQC36_gp015 [Proteus phage Vb_PmiP-P59]|uniref:Uncharacterized protein n=1 Tax=Proteus phage Vb_PmiP-P59 TaxID=2754975 RepID=A0A7G5CFY3_9CAUD|nr:hypothetical protein PQC36_gp015 [Proteus phage Vb_PmiP-P59]QMV48185.1 hypothetical protein [Proteus phage Vb_PmiP-P59]
MRKDKPKRVDVIEYRLLDERILNENGNYLNKKFKSLNHLQAYININYPLSLMAGGTRLNQLLTGKVKKLYTGKQGKKIVIPFKQDGFRISIKLLV